MDPTNIGHLRYGGAIVVATTLRVLAFLILAGGFTSAVVGYIALRDNGTSTSGTDAYIIGSVVTTIAVAALIAFCGYALQVLVDIFEQVWETRYQSEGES
jgi:hypothetical protein